MLETVQRFPCKVIIKQWNIDYHVSLLTLDLPQLSVWQKVAKLSLFYKIVSGAAVFPSVYYIQVPCNYNLSAHSFLHTSLCRTNYLLFSFIPHCVSLWNNLPVSIWTARSISSFKKLLLQYLITNSIGPCISIVAISCVPCAYTAQNYYRKKSGSFMQVRTIIYTFYFFLAVQSHHTFT